MSISGPKRKRDDALHTAVAALSLLPEHRLSAGAKYTKSKSSGSRVAFGCRGCEKYLVVLSKKVLCSHYQSMMLFVLYYLP